MIVVTPKVIKPYFANLFEVLVDAQNKNGENTTISNILICCFVTPNVFELSNLFFFGSC